jgi:Flp pilus assembly pilin Flp
VLRVLSVFWRKRRDDIEADVEVQPAPAAPLDDQEEPKRRQRGQSLVEYCILLTWVTLASMGLIRGISSSAKGIWTTTNSTLSSAKTTSGS